MSSPFSITGQEACKQPFNINRETFQLHFRFNASSLEKAYLNNQQTLEKLAEFFSNDTYLSQIDSISIRANASPGQHHIVDQQGGEQSSILLLVDGEFRMERIGVGLLRVNFYL